MNTAVVITLILVSIFLLILLSTYNGLIHLRQEIRRAWGRLDEQLKERYGLVSTLTQVVQSIGGDTAAKLPAITAAKNNAAVAFNPIQLAAAEADLTKAIGELLDAFETDPRLVGISSKLRANQKRIDQTCQKYNDSVHAMNASMTGFPHVMTARAIGLQLQPMFDLRTTILHDNPRI